VIVGLFTGMRRSEILGLRWSHIDLDAKVITVREAVEETDAGLRLKELKSKAGKRDIALPDIVVDALRADSSSSAGSPSGSASLLTMH
jgi:integrase